MSSIPHTRRRGSRLRRCLALFGLTVVLSLGAAEGASAVGQIEFGGCASDSGTGALCADLPGAPLDEPTALDTSPDGNTLYAAGTIADTVSVYNRAPAGQITYAGCVSKDGSGGLCADVPGNILDGPVSVAASRDGRSLYVANNAAHAVAEFKRLEGGQIVFDECYSDDSNGSLCDDIPGSPLDQMQDIAVSPDGASLYAIGDQHVVAFNRGDNGRLDYAGCVSNTGTGGLCADIPGTGPLAATQAVTVSPNGNSVYVTSQLGTIAVFDRAAGGQITFAGCVSSDGSGGECADVPGAGPLDTLQDVVVSPDNNQVYVASFGPSQVTVFDRAQGGQITYAGCVSEDGSGGLCADVPSEVLDHPDGLAVSPDGESLYVAAAGNSSVDVFDRAAGGQITYAGCVSDNGSAGFCADAPGLTLTATTGLTVSPDGRSLYATGKSADTVAHFFRRVRPDTTITSGPAEGAAVADPQPRFEFTADGQPATFECSIDGGTFAACASPNALAKLADGQHTFAVRATTAGDVDKSPATRGFSVDTTGPQVRFTRTPKGKLRTAKRRAKARFAFTSAEQGVRFECKVDKRRFKACGSPFRTKLRRGKHRVQVRGVDSLGNRGPAIAKRVKVVRRRHG